MIFQKATCPEVSPVLLFVEHHDVVNVLAFSILTTPRGRTRLSVFGHFARNSHHLAVLFLHGFDSVCIDPLYRNGVGIRLPGGWIVLSIEFRTVLDMDRLSVTVRSVPVASIL